MLTILGFSMVICFMYLIMTKRMSALIALILVPTLFALAAGFYQGLGAMMLDGIKTLAPTGVMLTFSILYFGIMIDAGLFDPLVRFILRLVKGDPLKVLVGTAVLTFNYGVWWNIDKAARSSIPSGWNRLPSIWAFLIACNEENAKRRQSG